MMLSAIPVREFPGPPAGLRPEEEPLVDLAGLGERRLRFSPAYFLRGLPGATPRFLLRRSAAERLQKALRLLPPWYGLCVLDAWRPFRVQQALYDDYCDRLRRENPALSGERLREAARKFVSPPSPDVNNPPVHTTGGAVDLTVVDEDGAPLAMGTEFDDFSEAAHAAYFEEHEGEEFRNNRRLLYRCMTQAGFTGLPTEWWHFDYGTNFWSYYTGQPARYTGIFGGEPAQESKERE